MLQQKRFKASEALDDILLKEVHPVTCESLNSEIAKGTIKKTREAAGPSGFDACRWRHIVISGNF